MKFQLNRFMVKLKSLRVWELDIDCGSSLMLELKKKVKGLMLQTQGIKIKPKPTGEIPVQMQKLLKEFNVVFEKPK